MFKLDLAGQVCPHCHATDSAVVETRSHAGVTYRARMCGACHARFTTEEKLVANPLAIGTVGAAKRAAQNALKS